MRVRKRRLAQKFFADRGTHLAAMIAYFALLSLMAIMICTLSLLGLAGRQTESSLLVRELRKVLNDPSVSSIITALNQIQANAATLGLIGAVVLIWTSLSLFSVLESAFNIVYGKPNRGFLHGKALALMLLSGSLLTLIVSLLVGSVGYDLLKRYAGDVLGNPVVAFGVALTLSFLGLLLFLFSAYWVLTNEPLTLHDVLPGAIVAAAVMAVTFQALPVYLRLVSSELVVLRALGAPVILLVWFYLMANVIVFGAEVNWWFRERRLSQIAPAAEPAGV